MKSDIEIAQEAVLLPIGKVAEKIGISEDSLSTTVNIRQSLQMSLLKRQRIIRMVSSSL